MKSFRLHTGSRRELLQFFVGCLFGVGALWLLHRMHIEDTALRVATALAIAAFVGTLWRGHFCRTLQQRYPHARWLGLLAVGLSILTVGVFARFIVPGGDEPAFTLGFVLAAGTCIAVFVVVNRSNPSVMK